MAVYETVDASELWFNMTDKVNYEIYGFIFGTWSDSETLDEQYRNDLIYYLMGIGGIIVCSLGLVANGLSLAVLTRGCMRSSTYTYLASLAVSDSLVLIFTVLLVINDVLKEHVNSGTISLVYTSYFPIVHPTAIVFQVTSIWLTLAFTVDRYIMICHPFRAENMCRLSRARKVVALLYVAGCIFCIPKFLEYRSHKVEIPMPNSTEVIYYYAIQMTEIAENSVFREVVHSWMYLVFVCGVPFFTLVILNAILIHAVSLSRLKGRELNAQERHRNDTTVMLIGVVILFLICQGPALVSRMTFAFTPSRARARGIITLNEVANFLVILNSAINIVPYYFFGKKFRCQFWRLFCRCVLDRDKLFKIVRNDRQSVDFGRRHSLATNKNCYIDGSPGSSLPPCATTPVGGPVNHNSSTDTPLMDVVDLG